MASHNGMADGQAHDRSNTILGASNSNITASGVLIAILLYYLLRSTDGAKHLLNYAWDALVYLTPTELIAAVDSAFSKADFTQDGHIAFNTRHHIAKSNALRRVLRLGNSGVLRVIKRSRTFSNLGGMIQGRPLDSPPGLGNWDNSCYQNSVLQGFSSLASLPAFLDSLHREEEDSTISALKSLTSTLNDEQNNGGIFWTPTKLKNMSSFQQQDAQEYYSKILDELDKDAAKAMTQHARQRNSKGLKSFDRDTSSLEEYELYGQHRPKSFGTTLRMSELPLELQHIITRNPLEGLLAQRVGCQKCGYVEGLSLVPFTCLTLPLGTGSFHDVSDCLDEFTALEPIEGVECVKCTLLSAEGRITSMLQALRSLDQGVNPNTLAYCELLRGKLDKTRSALDNQDFSDKILEKCQIARNHRVTTTKSRQAVIAREPKALILHINRSVFNELTGMQSKNAAPVRFPLRLSADRWNLGRLLQNQGSAATTEYWNTDPSRSMLSVLNPAKSYAEGFPYQLRALVTHYGKHESGHYVCYRQAPQNAEKAEADSHAGQRWWRLSDHAVTEVSEKALLALGGAFMLFYERIEDTDSSPSTPFTSVDTTRETSTKNTENLSDILEDNAEPMWTTDDDERLTPAEATMPLPRNNDMSQLHKRKRESSLPSDLSHSDTDLATTSGVEADHPGTKLPLQSEPASIEDNRSDDLEDETILEGHVEHALPTPPATPVLKQTIPNRSPRTGRDHSDSSEQAMESMAGFVQAI